MAPKRIAPAVADEHYACLVTDRLAAVIHSMHPRVAPIASELVQRHGKRFRPRLIHVAAGDPQHFSGDALTLGCIVEFIHIGSLLHDDVIDRSNERRGTPSAYFAQGPELAILAGTSCFATAGTLAAPFRQNIVAAIGLAMDTLADGELRDVERAWDLSMTDGDYLDLVRAKTGALFGLCCQLGALLSGHSSEASREYGRFGESFGTAFQLLDDCLEFSDAQAGKPLNNDCRLGLFSLPILFAHGVGDGQAKPSFLKLLYAETWTPRTHVRVREYVRSSGGVEHALATADAVLEAGQRRLLEVVDEDQARGLALFARGVFQGYRDHVA